MRQAGVVLAGGRSRRMGADKALLTVGGVSAVRRVVVALGVVGPVFVVARPGQPLPDLDAVVCPDELDDQGPLPALALGLRAARASGAAVVWATDAPLVTTAVAVALLARLGGHDVVLPVVSGRDQPLTAVYRTGLWTRAQRLVTTGERRVHALLTGADVVRVAAEDLPGGATALRSANTPQEWATLETTSRWESLDLPGDQPDA